jgi:hypothetical protein
MGNKITMKNNLIFFGFVVFSFLIHYFSELQLLKYSLKPFEVFFHEASHALAVLLSGRELSSISISFDGSGFISHRGNGWIGETITSFSGYLGASVWGFLIYISALYKQKWIKVFLMVFVLFFLIYVENITTTFILIGIAVTLFSLWKFVPDTISSLVLKFLGIFVNVSAIYSPTYLFYYSDSGDHIAMSELTLIPSLVWIVIWAITSILLLYASFKVTNTKKKMLEVERMLQKV